MARVLIATQGWGWVVDSSGNPRGGVSVTIRNLDGSNATHWSAVTGGTSSTAAVTTNANGTIPRYLEEGSYDVTVATDAAVRVEAATGNTLKVLREAPINVKQSEYGAVGDGTTVDTTPVQAAITAAAGGEIYLPRGIYRVADLTIPDEGVMFVGDGLGSGGTVLKAASSATYVLKCQGKRYVALRNLIIDGNGRASRGLLYEATAGATSQQVMLDRVRFYRCTRGFHVGPGAGGVSQADKSTLLSPGFIECDYGIYNEAPNGQQTVLVNADFTTTYVTSVYMTAGTLRIIGGQFQGSGAANTKGIEFAGYNIDWCALDDVIFEGPEWDVYENFGAAWPRDGLTATNVVFQGPSSNVVVNTTNARMTARHCRFNADFDPPTVGNGYISWNQAGGVLVLESCDYAVPAITGSNPPEVVYNRPVSASVASAATVTLPHGADLVSVTGTTGITGITAQRAGRMVTLMFADVLTVTDGSNLKLAGNFTTSADDTLSLICDGTNWVEIARSAN